MSTQDSKAEGRWQLLLAAFSAELEERVRELTQLLLRLEGDQDEGTRRAVYDALFREAHNLKGAARAVDVGAIEAVTHGMESALEAVRHTAAHPPPAWFDAMYRGVDAFLPLYQAARGEGAGAPQVPDLLAALRNVAEAPPADDGAGPVLLADGQLANGAGNGRPEPPDLLPALTVPLPTGKQSAAGELSAGPASGTLPPPSLPAQEPSGRGEGSVRVAVSKLDSLLAQAGELAVTQIRVGQRLGELGEMRQQIERWRRALRASRGLRAGLRHRVGERHEALGAMAGEVEALIGLADAAEEQLAALLGGAAALAGRLREDTAQLGLVTRAIGDEVITVRLLPVATIFAPLERLVRDVGRETGKEVRLILHGGEAEIDRKILEGLRDPLMHMLRNAVDHGIEAPDQREAQGKARTGAITLAAAARSGELGIVLEDDGGGLDPDRIRAAAVAKGLMSEGQAAALADSAALELMFLPGFSTRTVVSQTSGRGVGMDVVRENVQRLGGHLLINSVLGQGTRFTIRVPLTVATTRALVLEQSDQLFALPSLMVERTQRVREESIITLEGSRAVTIAGTAVPVVELADALERPRSAPPDAAEWRPYLVLRQGDQRVALLVDRLVGEQEIVIKSLGWPLRAVRNVGGAAVLGSGHTVVILNPADLLKTGLALTARSAARPAITAEPDVPAAGRDQRRRRLLVVEDSLTTRTLETSILEAAGYEVVAAADGLEALQILRAQTIDLVVSDVEMPRLDGFGLTVEMRRDQRLGQIPVVLVTSLEAAEYRERGMAAGADAYVVKSRFEQGQLLDTVGRLL